MQNAGRLQTIACILDQTRLREVSLSHHLMNHVDSISANLLFRKSLSVRARVDHDRSLDEKNLSLDVLFHVKFFEDFRRGMQIVFNVFN